MNRFDQVKEILDTAVGGPAAPVAGPHGAFWRTLTRDQFVAFKVLGLPLVSLSNGSGSTLVKALRAETPFGKDIGTPGASLRRMPAGRDPVPPEQIDFISTWIDDGCPEEADQVGALEATVDGAPSGRAFVIASDGATAIPGRLILHTTDGSQGDVSLRTATSSPGSLTFTQSTVHVSSSPIEVGVGASTTSTAVNDTIIEVMQGPTVLVAVALTVIARPSVRFRGSFQCRLATDPDPFDHPWGEDSSFGMYAVEGPDPDHPDEPPLDRIVRFHDEVALRPFCDPVGVFVTGIEATVGGNPAQFAVGDDLIGQPVRLGPECKFDGRNRTFAPDGFEPISDFHIEIGSSFSGNSAPAETRSSPADPPPSTAPYANGIILLDADPTGGRPADFGIAAATWAENAWTTLATKLAALVAQQPQDERGQRIRDRRIQEHTDTRPGHGLTAIATPLVFMERYTGLIDRQLVVAPDPRGVLAYLATLPAVRFTADFLGFDTDCQTGKVTGTFDAPEPPGPSPAALAPPHAGLTRTPLEEQ